MPTYIDRWIPVTKKWGKHNIFKDVEDIEYLCVIDYSEH